jgi:2-dehydro-3-deoxyphosphogluconate aldolase / (4S)-4-hydroxy-2-oxoglutarate aldolase
MAEHRFDLQRFLKMPVMAIVRGLTREDLDFAVPVLLSVGINTIEVTLNTPEAISLIRFLKARVGDGLQVGAGTVRSLDDLHAALSAGASFIVTPVLQRQVIRTCVGDGIPVFPGAFTPSEIFEAHEAGATMVKVFPASSLGPKYFRSLKAPLPDIKLMPTGGVDKSSMKEYLAAGADAFGIGSPLFAADLIRLRDHRLFSEHVQGFTELFEKP